jgi:hypothetical protein
MTKNNEPAMQYAFNTLQGPAFYTQSGTNILHFGFSTIGCVVALIIAEGCFTVIFYVFCTSILIAK